MMQDDLDPEGMITIDVSVELWIEKRVIGVSFSKNMATESVFNPRRDAFPD